MEKTTPREQLTPQGTPPGTPPADDVGVGYLRADLVFEKAASSRAETLAAYQQQLPWDRTSVQPAAGAVPGRAQELRDELLIRDNWQTTDSGAQLLSSGVPPTHLNIPASLLSSQTVNEGAGAETPEATDI